MAKNIFTLILLFNIYSDFIKHIYSLPVITIKFQSCNE
jgi:hypothetical protein